MITTLDLLNRFCDKNQVYSMREVAKLLDISHSTVQNWRNGKTMSDDQACIIADMLGLDVDFVLLAIIAERSKNNRAIEALHKLESNQKIA